MIDEGESMYPWPEPIWQPGEVAFSTVRSGGVHVVRLRVHPASTLDLAWQRLSQTLRADDDVLLEGGASLRRVSANELEVVSGGEDALDSISWTINVTVAEAAGNADVEVSVEQARSSDVD